MKENVEIKRFKEQMQAICCTMFESNELLHAQLHYIYYHLDEKWYNLISIFSNDSCAVDVHSLVDWAKLLDVKTVYPKKLQVSIPYAEIYQEVNDEMTALDDNEMITKVFDYKQLDFSYDQFHFLRNQVYTLEDPFLSLFDNFENFVTENKNVVYDVSNECIKQHEYFKIANLSVQKFIENSIKIIYQDHLHLEEGSHLESLSIPNEQYFDVYKAILDIAKDVFENVSNRYVSYMEDIKHEDYLIELSKRRKRTLQIRIRDAKKSVQIKEKNHER